MAQSTKRAIRAAAGEFNQLTNEELRKRVQEPLTESQFAAIQRVYAQRGMKMPEEHGEVSEDPAPGTRVISLEEFSNADFGLLARSRRRDRRHGNLGHLLPEVIPNGHITGPGYRFGRLRHTHLCPQKLARTRL